MSVAPRGLPSMGTLNLTVKMVLAVAAAALLLATFVWLVVGPRTAAAVGRGTEPLVAQSAATMRAGAREAVRELGDTLRTVIRHTTLARRAALGDLPLELHGGDPDRVRAAIARHDAAQSERLLENVARLATEMERRAMRRIDADTDALVAAQRAVTAGMAGELRDSSLLLLSGAVAALLLLLGLGLHRLVVRPVLDLQRAASAVAEGRLDVPLTPRGNDEVARLVGAFAVMLAQLRAAQAEVRAKQGALDEANAKLESKVVAKTAQLQQALHALQTAQRELVLAERMASVGTLAGGIAHEFNNLAGGIRGCARELLTGEADPQRREPLEVIERAAGRAIEVTEKLLRFARPRPPGKSVVDVAALVRDAIALVEPQARQQAVRVRGELAADLRVRGDDGALHQVVVNLLGNALQAMPDGGVLEVSSRRSDADVVITVRDTGVGMSAAHLERIFDPFFTTRGADAATPGHGAGLGLAISYGIVQAHGGRLLVESEQGVGSTFTLHLPALAAEVPRVGEAP